MQELLFFATQIHDYPLLMSHHIQRGEWVEALKVLYAWCEVGVMVGVVQVMCLQQDEEAFYKYSPLLMRCSPVRCCAHLAPRADPVALRLQTRAWAHRGCLATLSGPGTSQAHPCHDAL